MGRAGVMCAHPSCRGAWEREHLAFSCSWVGDGLGFPARVSGRGIPRTGAHMLGSSQEWETTTSNDPVSESISKRP